MHASSMWGEFGPQFIMTCDLYACYLLQNGTLEVSILVTCEHFLKFLCLLGSAEAQTCRDNYTTLANALISNSANKYQLSVVFFPTDRTPPSFVNVTYQYDDTNLANETWLWSTGAFYFFQPLRIYQFSSLFFGDPEFRSSNITLVLPGGCANAEVQIMETLTQRVRDTCTFYPCINLQFTGHLSYTSVIVKQTYKQIGWIVYLIPIFTASREVWHHPGPGVEHMPCLLKEA